MRSIISTCILQALLMSCGSHKDHEPANDSETSNPRLAATAPSDTVRPSPTTTSVSPPRVDPTSHVTSLSSSETHTYPTPPASGTGAPSDGPTSLLENPPPVEDLAVKPFNGIWIAEINPTPIVPASCQTMFLIDSAIAQIVRAMICDDGRIQEESYRIQTSSPRDGIFPNAKALEVKTTLAASSCPSGVATNIWPTGTFVFDYSTASSGVDASYMFASDGADYQVVRNGGSMTELLKNNQCEVITMRSKKPEHSKNTILLNAAKVCNLKDQKKGCFTAGGFKI